MELLSTSQLAIRIMSPERIVRAGTGVLQISSLRIFHLRYFKGGKDSCLGDGAGELDAFFVSSNSRFSTIGFLRKSKHNPGDFAVLAMQNLSRHRSDFLFCLFSREEC